MLKKSLLLAATALLFSACQFGLSTPSSPTLSLSGGTPTPTVTPRSTAVLSPDSQSGDPDINLLLNQKPNEKMYATIKTNLGSMRIQLFPEKAPNTVANFVGLVEGTKEYTDLKTDQKVSGKPFYNGVIFHRVIKDFMIQGGDPLGAGFGGPGYKFADETTGESYTRGTLAMANSGPNTNGSQFFIVHKDYPLPPSYTVFGRIDANDSASLATLDKIALVKTDANDKPLSPVTIESISIARE